MHATAADAGPASGLQGADGLAQAAGCTDCLLCAGRVGPASNAHKRIAAAAAQAQRLMLKL